MAISSHAVTLKSTQEEHSPFPLLQKKLPKKARFISRWKGIDGMETAASYLLATC